MIYQIINQNTIQYCDNIVSLFKYVNVAKKLYSMCICADIVDRKTLMGVPGPSKNNNIIKPILCSQKKKKKTLLCSCRIPEYTYMPYKIVLLSL